MASKRRKSAAIALAFVGIAGLSLASASQLNLTGGTLQAGQITADCQTSGAIGVSYTSAWDATNKYYAVSAVSFSNVDAACNGKNLEVKLLKADGSVLATYTGTAKTGTATSVPFSPVQKVSDVASLAAIING